MNSWNFNLVFNRFHIFSAWIENFSLPENTRSCWPVRPIPRRTSYVQDTVTAEAQQSSANATTSAATTLTSSSAAIGVVIPTTPNTLHQHQNQLNEQLLHHNQHLLSIRVPDGIPLQQQHQQQQQPRNVVGSFNNDKTLPTEDRLAQIQDYIRITTSLIDSFNSEKVAVSAILSKPIQTIAHMTCAIHIRIRAVCFPLIIWRYAHC